MPTKDPALGPRHFTRPANFKPGTRLGRKVEGGAHLTGSTGDLVRLAYAIMENPNEWILAQTYTKIDPKTGKDEGLKYRVDTAAHSLRRYIFAGVNREGIVSISKPIVDMYGPTIFKTHAVEAESDIMDNGDVQVWIRWTERLQNVA